MTKNTRWSFRSLARGYGFNYWLMEKNRWPNLWMRIWMFIVQNSVGLHFSEEFDESTDQRQEFGTNQSEVRIQFLCDMGSHIEYFHQLLFHKMNSSSKFRSLRCVRTNYRKIPSSDELLAWDMMPKTVLSLEEI